MMKAALLYLPYWLLTTVYCLLLSVQVDERFEGALEGVVAVRLKLFEFFGGGLADLLPEGVAGADVLFGERAAAVVAGGAPQGEQPPLAVRAEAEVRRLARHARRAAVRALRRPLFHRAVAIITSHRRYLSARRRC